MLRAVLCSHQCPFPTGFQFAFMILYLQLASSHFALHCHWLLTLLTSYSLLLANRAGGKKSDRRRFWHFMERGRRPRKRGDPKGRRVWDFTDNNTSSSTSSRLIRTLTSLQFWQCPPIMSAIILCMWRLAGRKKHALGHSSKENCVSGKIIANFWMVVFLQ